MGATSYPHTLSSGRLSIDPDGEVTAIAAEQQPNSWFGAVFSDGSLDCAVAYGIESKLELGAGIGGSPGPVAVG